MTDQGLLTAELRYIAFLNFAVDPELLQPHVPEKLKLDVWNGKTYLSLVGMLFLNAESAGIPLPFHQKFEQVNLRFYVKREVSTEPRHGVVFIKEIVPKAAIATAARWAFNEKYITLPMQHSINIGGDTPVDQRNVEYGWETEKGLNFMRVKLEGELQSFGKDSFEEFIMKRHWGYSHGADGTFEYRFDHPEWKFWRGKDPELVCDVAELYGREFVNFLTLKPNSVFLANGSPATIYKPVLI